MQVDIFKEILVPVVGGLGIFMLGLEFMSDGINHLAANRMREMLAKIAGTPSKGLFAGTLITGVLQSSTAMTVMVVGLVNAGVIALRPAISVIMGANIGTTLGNGLIALPLGPLGLILAGIFALVYVFSKVEKTKNVALALMGFALIFYGLNLMTGGLKPLRSMPEVMSAISALKADSFMGLIYCVMTAAVITALIHSSSATIGIVMGLGAAGVLNWYTAVAFSLGADLGTTITSWMASLHLSKNAKRAAYAHISFNFIGVALMLPLFFLSMDLLRWVMGFFGGDPGKAVIDATGKETFPLVPVAVGLYSTAFNVFNTVVLFPFIGVFERVLSRIGRSVTDDEEDYSLPRHLAPGLADQLKTAMPAVQQEMARYLEASRMMLAAAKGDNTKFKSVHDHQKALDSLSREMRRFTANVFRPELSPQQTDLVASLIEEEDFSASLGETLYQIARRVERQPFAPAALEIVKEILDVIDRGVAEHLGYTVVPAGSSAPLQIDPMHAIAELRQRCLLARELPGEDRGALLALLGSAERAFYLAERIQSERRSVSRELPELDTVPDAGLVLGTLAPEKA
jgi:phosphate:Na+ symporter